MWNKEAQPEVPGVSASKDSKIPGAPANAPAGIRPSTPLARTLALLGSTIVVKGEITSDEDLQIDGRVEGPVSLRGNRLTVGRSGQLNSEVTAREVIVYGNVSGNLRARDRVEIKKDGRVIGDIATARISIEDGAYFKGHIEIEHTQSSAPEKTEKKEAELIPVGAGAY
jgi:cytoskeletal protein CcmA (bactofilin family)